MRYKLRKRSHPTPLVIPETYLCERVNGKDIIDSSDEIIDEKPKDIQNIDLTEDSNDTISVENEVQEEEEEPQQEVVKTEDNVIDKLKSIKESKKSAMSSMSSTDDIIAKLKENDSYFSSLIDLIPAKIYFEGNDEILESMEQQKKDLFGDDLDLSLSKKSKQKRFKLDPNSGQKISEIADSFYNKSNKKSNSTQNQSMDKKMTELRKKLNEKILKLKSKRGQKLKNMRESKKERKKLNSLRASKQKGFSKRQFIETNDANSNGTTDQTKTKPKKIKTEDMTDGTDARKLPKLNCNLPKIYNQEGNIVYSKFDLVSPSLSLAEKKKNSKKNKLHKLLAKTKKEEQKMSELEAKNAPKAQEVKEKKLWKKAIDLSEGIKVKDNSKLIKKSIMKKRMDRTKSAKKWTERNETVQNNMDARQQKRTKNIKERKKATKDRQIKKLKKRGRIIDTKH